MGMKLILASMLIMGLVISVSVSTVSALDSDQKTVILNVERGRTVKFYLYMSGGGSADITHSGDINGWVSHPDTISSGEWLGVDIDVPDDAEIKSYTENIIAEGSIVTKVTVLVTAPINNRLNTIKNLIDDVMEEQEDLEDYFEDRMDETNAKITSIEVALSEMGDDMNEMASNQKEVQDVESQYSTDKNILQQMINKLETDKTSLEEENQQLNDLTGMITVNWSGAGFVLGVLVVVAVLVIYFRVGPKIGSLRSPGGGFRGKLRRSGGSAKKPAASQGEPEVAVASENADLAAPAASGPSHERIRGPDEFRYSFKAR